ncbi:MAG: hypothetical protein HZC36_09795 [Armatimonadetes bacterium]|nr:hypothetical protein [Armatimonadota bacterium]
MRPLQPIPEIDDTAMNDVVIDEQGERLVPVVDCQRIWTLPAYHLQGYSSAPPEVMLREGARNALAGATKKLPDGIGFLVWDGLRNLATQQEIALRFEGSEVMLSIPHGERASVLNQYVSPVPVSEDEFFLSPPPHTTGGAVDLTLCDEKGVPLDMGADFDEFGTVSWLCHYEDVDNVSDENGRYRQSMRRLLYWTMVEAGFAPYPWEYWHYEFGTQRAAAFHGKGVADYGPAVAFQRFSGALR